jgi:hypothetical protein
MKVISLVPSWTEMLISSGVNVVGRTRFCLHPQDQVKSIAVVGGTKDLDWQKLRELKADLLILDQEENLPWMRDEAPIPVLVTHVTSVAGVADEILKIADAIPESRSELKSLAERWRKVSQVQRPWNWEKIPGELECLRRDSSSYKNLVYVIWKKPWMRIAKGSFIASVLQTLGAGPFLVDHDKKYPEFQMEDWDLNSTYFLFSSEPFPFHRQKAELLKLGVQGSIVDGESYSWFGIRSLRFLENEWLGE